LIRPVVTETLVRGDDPDAGPASSAGSNRPVSAKCRGGWCRTASRTRPRVPRRDRITPGVVHQKVEGGCLSLTRRQNRVSEPSSAKSRRSDPDLIGGTPRLDDPGRRSSRGRCRGTRDDGGAGHRQLPRGDEPRPLLAPVTTAVRPSCWDMRTDQPIPVPFRRRLPRSQRWSDRPAPDTRPPTIPSPARPAWAVLPRRSAHQHVFWPAKVMRSQPQARPAPNCRPPSGSWIDRGPQCENACCR